MSTLAPTLCMPFHLAVPVDDLDEARAFYGGVLGLEEGRSTDQWIDYDFFGHQFVVHTGNEKGLPKPPLRTSNVGDHAVPIPHFGVVLTMDDFHALAGRLRAKGVQFIIEPTLRFQGQPGEQATMFFRDPSGNCLEFKAFADLRQLFAK